MPGCARVRRFLLESETGSLDRRLERAMRGHLASCPSCRAHARASERIAGDLMRLRGERIADVDVAARVMARIAVAGPAPREEVPGRQIAWIAAALGAVALAALATAVAQAPVLLGGIERTGLAAQGLWAAVAAFASAGRGAFAALGGLVLDAAAFASRVLVAADGRLPSFSVLVLTAILAVTATTILVLRRDLRRTSGSRSEKEV